LSGQQADSQSFEHDGNGHTTLDIIASASGNMNESPELHTNLFGKGEQRKQLQAAKKRVKKKKG
jgi:hypothetical protein